MENALRSGTKSLIVSVGGAFRRSFATQNSLSLEESFLPIGKRVKALLVAIVLHLAELVEKQLDFSLLMEAICYFLGFL